MTALMAAQPCVAEVPFRVSIRSAFPGWVAARLIVISALGLVSLRYNGLSHTGALLIGSGWSGWDAAWYAGIAEDGYAAHGIAATRFFPLLPMLARAVSTVSTLPVPLVLIAISWTASLLFAALLHRLVLRETGDFAAARRAAWLIQLVPGANALVLGYTEALAGFLAVLFFVVIRLPGRHWLAVPAGVLGGLLRPVGMLLALPAMVQVASDRHRPRRARLALVAAAVSAPAATAAYLGWCWWRWGDPLLPYRVHTASELRGGIVDVQWRYLFHTSPGGYPWPMVLALLGGASVAMWWCAKLLPIAYTVWAATGFVVSATAFGFHSMPRYLASLFPLVMTAALALRTARAFCWVLAVAIPLFAWVSYLNFTRYVVP